VLIQPDAARWTP